MAYIPDEAVDAFESGNISDHAFILYVYLCRCRNGKTGKVCPSIQTIAKATRIHPKTVYRFRSELKEKGWITLTSEGLQLVKGFSARSSCAATVGNTGKDVSAAAADLQVLEAPEVATQLPEVATQLPEVATQLPEVATQLRAYKEEPAKEPAKEPNTFAADAATPADTPISQDIPEPAQVSTPDASEEPEESKIRPTGQTASEPDAPKVPRVPKAARRATRTSAPDSAPKTNGYHRAVVSAWVEEYKANHCAAMSPSDAEQFPKNFKHLNDIRKTLGYDPDPDFFRVMTRKYLEKPSGNRRTFADLCQWIPDLVNGVGEAQEWTNPADLADAYALTVSGYKTLVKGKPTALIPWVEFWQIVKTARILRERFGELQPADLRRMQITTVDLWANALPANSNTQRLRPENLLREFDALVRLRAKEESITPDEESQLLGLKK